LYVYVSPRAWKPYSHANAYRSGDRECAAGRSYAFKVGSASCSALSRIL
jgi:hypothetical protein